MSGKKRSYWLMGIVVLAVGGFFGHRYLKGGTDGVLQLETVTLSRPICTPAQEVQAEYDLASARARLLSALGRD